MISAPQFPSPQAAPAVSSMSQQIETSRQTPIAICLSPPKPSREQIYEQIASVICKVETTRGTATGFFIGDNLVAVPFHALSLEQVGSGLILNDILCFFDGNVYEATCCDDGYPFDTILNID